jgi:hypothetical protein
MCRVFRGFFNKYKHNFGQENEDEEEIIGCTYYVNNIRNFYVCG